MGIRPRSIVHYGMAGMKGAPAGVGSEWGLAERSQFGEKWFGVRGVETGDLRVRRPVRTRRGGRGRRGGGAAGSRPGAVSGGGWGAGAALAWSLSTARMARSRARRVASRRY